MMRIDAAKAIGIGGVLGLAVVVPILFHSNSHTVPLATTRPATTPTSTTPASPTPATMTSATTMPAIKVTVAPTQRPTARPVAKAPARKSVPPARMVTIRADSTSGRPLLTITNQGDLKLAPTAGPRSRIVLMPLSGRAADRNRFLIESPVDSEEIDAYCVSSRVGDQFELKVCDQKDLSQIFEFSPQGGSRFIVSSRYGLFKAKGTGITNSLDETPTTFTVIEEAD